MTRSTPHSSAPTLPLVIAMLARLRRKGARLEPDAAMYRIVYPGERRRAAVASRTEPSRLVPSELVAFARLRGWLATTSSDDAALRLTELGALASHRGADPRLADIGEVRHPSDTPAVTRARATLSPLARMRQLRDGKGVALLTGAQVEAGERLASDFVKGQMMPRVTSNWDRAALGFAAEHRGRAGAADVSDGAAAAQERVRRALAEAGPEFSDLLMDVCCLELGIEVVEKRRVWPAGVGRVVLSLGLNKLMRHYGIVAAGATHGRTAHWRALNSRPTETGSRDHAGAP